MGVATQSHPVSKQVVDNVANLRVAVGEVLAVGTAAPEIPIFIDFQNKNTKLSR